MNHPATAVTTIMVFVTIIKYRVTSLDSIPCIAVKENFDMISYYGEWYKVGSYRKDTSSDCQYMTYNKDAHNTTMHRTRLGYYSKLIDSKKVLDFNIRLSSTLPKPNTGIIISRTLEKNGEKKECNEITLFILETDYHRVSIQYSCLNGKVYDIGIYVRKRALDDIFKQNKFKEKVAKWLAPTEFKESDFTFMDFLKVCPRENETREYNAVHTEYC